MSFSSEVKGELARNPVEKKCCMLAEISGFLRVAGSIRLAGGGNFIIVASTENPAIARHYKKLIKEYFGSTANLEIGGSQAPGKSGGKGRRYSLTVSPDEKSSQILRETGMLLIREGNDYLSDGIYQPIVKSKCDKKSYIRGLFLGCGTISDPHKSYHMEFVLESRQVANDLKKLIGTFVDLEAGITERKNSYIVYLKRASYISDMLGIMGASSAMMEFENIRIGHSIKSEVQRIANCDNANMDRALSASEEQIRYINRIKDTIGLEALEPVLRDTATARLENPEANLTEIGEILTPPIKKPGVAKRFARIKAIAEGLSDEDTGRQ